MTLILSLLSKGALSQYPSLSEAAEDITIQSTIQGSPSLSVLSSFEKPAYILQQNCDPKTDSTMCS